ncbi:odorant receptor 22c-like isoform X3 [Anoplolepis gracilipes]|uniref:odorant receptor 22c-like isoform X3 n=1 Tax=Anoplolepis gracilipes TaxID=354296 RepID=UPI003B9ED0ED
MTATTTISPSLKIGLRLLGMWPNVRYSTVYWLIFMLGMLIIQYFQYLYVIGHLNMSKLYDLVDSLPATLDYTLTLFKMVSLWINRRVLHRILLAVDNDWRECVNVEQHFYVMKIKAYISHFCSNAMLSCNVIAGVLYLLSDYAIHFVYLVDDYNDTLRQLPIKIQLPFEFQQSPIFELLVVILFVHTMIHVCAIAILNGLIFTLVLHASGQIDIICQEFRNISEKTSLYGASAPILGMLIDRHNNVISFSNNIEKLFSFIGLMQIVWNTLIICCLGFIIVISVNSGANVGVLVKTIFAYFAIMMEAFIICFAGEYLSLKSKSIADAAYETLWYNMPPSQSKVMTFIIMRSNKRLTITAGKMTDMSFETFSSIIRASASYISVLYAMY